MVIGSVPGARAVGGKPEVISGGTNWSEKIVLHERNQMLFVIFEVCIWGALEIWCEVL